MCLGGFFLLLFDLLNPHFVIIKVGRRGERGPCHAPGGKVPPGKADAGLFGQAGAVSGTGSDGPAGPGQGSAQGRLSLFDGE